MSEKINIKNNVQKDIKLNSYKTNNTVSNNKIIKSDTVDLTNNVKVNNYNETTNTNSFLNIARNTAATIEVGRIKIASGIFDVLEHIGDGGVWTGGKIVEGHTYLIAQLVGLINENAKDTVLEWKNNVKDWTKETIEVNIVDEFEKEFFNTDIGHTINNDSYMKYDSNTANTIENVTKVGAEIVGATAATIATGGAASPTMVAVVGGLGFAEGTGEHAQKTYQESLKTTGAKETSIFFSGIANGASWVAKGLFGSATLQQVGNISNIASNASSVGNRGNLFKEALTTHKLRSLGAYIFRTRNKARELQNVVDVVGSVFDTLSESIDNNESISRTATKVGVGLVSNIAINRLIDMGSLWSHDLRASANIAEIAGHSINTVNFKKSIQSATQLLIEQFDTFIDSGFYETDFGNKIIDNAFDKFERRN